jgi:hypothetical protein
MRREQVGNTEWRNPGNVVPALSRRPYSAFPRRSYGASATGRREHLLFAREKISETQARRPAASTCKATGLAADAAPLRFVESHTCDGCERARDMARRARRVIRENRNGAKCEKEKDEKEQRAQRRDLIKRKRRKVLDSESPTTYMSEHRRLVQSRSPMPR